MGVRLNANLLTVTHDIIGTENVHFLDSLNAENVTGAGSLIARGSAKLARITNASLGLVHINGEVAVRCTGADHRLESTVYNTIGGESQRNFFEAVFYLVKG